jgi:N-acetylmuramoyl-L-alanine amidase
MSLQSISSGLSTAAWSRATQDSRTVEAKKAPFVVLIGANMPSILAEISFLTNPDDARELLQPAYREGIADSLYQGVAKYVNGLSWVRFGGEQRTRRHRWRSYP